MLLPEKTFAQIQITPADVGQTNPPSANDATLQQALSLVYFIAGIVCVVMVIVGGIRYVTSGGDSNGTQSAKNTIMYALIGLVIILLAAAITQLVFEWL